MDTSTSTSNITLKLAHKPNLCAFFVVGSPGKVVVGVGMGLNDKACKSFQYPPQII